MIGANYFRRKLLRKVAKRLGWQVYCGICGGRDLTLQTATLDHVMPKSLGGSNHHSNLQFAHSKCNGLKGNKMMPIIVYEPGTPEYKASLDEMFRALEHNRR